MTIQIPPELFAEWLAEGRRQYSETALIAGFVADKAAEWAADQQLMKVNEWIRCLEGSPRTGIRWELEPLQLDCLGHELCQAMRPKPLSKAKALIEFDALMSKLDDEGDYSNCAGRIRRALESIPDADS